MVSETLAPRVSKHTGRESSRAAFLHYPQLPPHVTDMYAPHRSLHKRCYSSGSAADSSDTPVVGPKVIVTPTPTPSVHVNRGKVVWGDEGLRYIVGPSTDLPGSLPTPARSRVVRRHTGAGVRCILAPEVPTDRSPTNLGNRPPLATPLAAHTSFTDVTSAREQIKAATPSLHLQAEIDEIAAIGGHLAETTQRQTALDSAQGGVTPAAAALCVSLQRASDASELKTLLQSLDGSVLPVSVQAAALHRLSQLVALQQGK